MTVCGVKNSTKKIWKFYIFLSIVSKSRVAMNDLKKDKESDHRTWHRLHDKLYIIYLVNGRSNKWKFYLRKCNDVIHNRHRGLTSTCIDLLIFHIFFRVIIWQENERTQRKDCLHWRWKVNTTRRLKISNFLLSPLLLLKSLEKKNIFMFL